MPVTCMPPDKVGFLSQPLNVPVTFLREHDAGLDARLAELGSQRVCKREAADASGHHQDFRHPTNSTTKTIATRPVCSSVTDLGS